MRCAVQESGARPKPDQFLAAPRPAPVKPWICHQNCQVVSATVSPRLRTRRASSDLILTHDSCLAHMIENAKPRLPSASSLLSDWLRYLFWFFDVGSSTRTCSACSS